MVLQVPQGKTDMVPGETYGELRLNICLAVQWLMITHAQTHSLTIYHTHTLSLKHTLSRRMVVQVPQGKTDVVPGETYGELRLNICLAIYIYIYIYIIHICIFFLRGASLRMVLQVPQGKTDVVPGETYGELRLNICLAVQWLNADAITGPTPYTLHPTPHTLHLTH